MTSPACFRIQGGPLSVTNERTNKGQRKSSCLILDISSSTHPTLLAWILLFVSKIIPGNQSLLHVGLLKFKLLVSSPLSQAQFECQSTPLHHSKLVSELSKQRHRGCRPHKSLLLIFHKICHVLSYIKTFASYKYNALKK